MAPLPPYQAQLARLVKSAPDGPEWLHEMKYDGYRIGCRIERGDVTLISRNGKDWTDAFPEVRQATQQLGVRQALLDGEVAIVLPDGRTSFQALQNAFSGASRRGLVYFVFDLLHLEGESIARRPLEDRKRELLRMVGKPGPRSRIRYSEHVIGQGRRMLDEACRLGLEGIVSKRRDAPYKPGRSDLWVKTKCTLRQEFVIGGFTDPEGSRHGIGALLVGAHDRNGTLTFAGKVGTGFTAASARELRSRLNRIERTSSPFSPPPAGWLGKHAHWVQPELVAEVAFTEWTDEGRIRHPSFQGLRRDRDPKEVVRESTAPAPPPTTGTLVPAASAPKRSTRSREEAAEIAGVRISHPTRVLYPESGITKIDVARFYERIEKWILPHLRGRPLTLVRCPTGISDECFYMKHSKVWAPPAVRRVRIQEKSKLGEYLVVDTLPALVSLVQMDVLEIHTWNSHVDAIEQPNRLVLDIDPGGQVPWRAVIDAARLVRRLLEAVDLEGFAKTTGGRGLHVVVPLTPAAEWRECLAFTRALAHTMERHHPALFTTAFAKAGRERKILVDYLRNNRTNTSVAAFSTRARTGAPVSVPIRWAELTDALDPAAWTMLTMERRLARLRSDPWREYWKSTQRLSKRMTEAVSGVL